MHFYHLQLLNLALILFSHIFVSHIFVWIREISFYSVSFNTFSLENDSSRKTLQVFADHDFLIQQTRDTLFLTHVHVGPSVVPLENWPSHILSFYLSASSDFPIRAIKCRYTFGYFLPFSLSLSLSLSFILSLFLLSTLRKRLG